MEQIINQSEFPILDANKNVLDSSVLLLVTNLQEVLNDFQACLYGIKSHYISCNYYFSYSCVHIIS